MHKNVSRTSLCRAVCVLAVASFGAELCAGAQTPSADLSFEVATVKPVLMDAAHPFNPRHFGPHVTPAGASYWSMSVAYLVEHVFGLDLNQVTGPEWTSHDQYDIEARFAEGADQKDEQKMLLALLRDRFKLSFHIEKRELDVEALVVGKHGEKLKPSPPDPATPEAAADSKPEDSNAAKPEVIKNPDGSSSVNKGKAGTQTIKFDKENWAMHWEVSKMTMEQLAKNLSICLGIGFHKVVDETGIKGNYQVAFDCPQPRPQRAAGSGAAGGLSSEPQDDSSLTRSLDSLGLRLEKRKMLTDVYVIDHVERPTEN